MALNSPSEKKRKERRNSIAEKFSGEVLVQKRRFGSVQSGGRGVLPLGKPRPDKPPRSGEELIRQLYQDIPEFFKKNPGLWPCVTCMGEGKVSKYDQIVECEACKGSGKGTRKEITAHVRELENNWTNEMIGWNAEWAYIKAIRKKLSRTELCDLLEWYGVCVGRGE